MVFMILFRLLLVLSSLSFGACGTLSDAQSLYTALTGSVNRYLRPKYNQSEPTEVALTVFLKSISALDEVNGILSGVFAIDLSWNDDSISWTPSSYGGIGETKLDSSLIWVPEFTLGNPAKKLTTIGVGNIPVTIQSSGEIVHQIADLFETTCDVDVTYFPFDTQNCVIELLPLGYKSDISLNIGGTIQTNVYAENNLWILTSTKSELSTLGGLPYARLSLSLDRRYSFFILNLFSPVIIMVILNVMVFVLPPDSGERVGYAVTCLLALSVYMTFASESLPVSSKPIPVVTYVLLAYVVISSAMCMEVILGLKFHLHDDSSNPPKFLEKMCCFMTSRKCSASVSHQTSGRDIENLNEKYPEEDSTSDKNRNLSITWRQIGRRFDQICFYANLFSVLIISAIYIIVVS